MDQGTALVLAAAIAGAPGLVTAFGVHRMHRTVKDTKAVATQAVAELVTLNGGTVGSFAADDETRRIEAIPRELRTATEQAHLETAPPPEPPQGPAR